jgi:hypothetical protein
MTHDDDYAGVPTTQTPAALLCPVITSPRPSWASQQGRSNENQTPLSTKHSGCVGHIKQPRSRLPRSRQWLTSTITLAALLHPVVTSLLATESPATTTLQNHSIHIHMKHVIQQPSTVTQSRSPAMTHDDEDAAVVSQPHIHPQHFCVQSSHHHVHHLCAASLRFSYDNHYWASPPGNMPVTTARTLSNWSLMLSKCSTAVVTLVCIVVHSTPACSKNSAKGT